MRGMLVKDKGKEGIVLTPDGVFVQGKVEEAASLGDEVEVEPPVTRQSFWWLAVAVAVVCLGGYPFTASPCRRRGLIYP